jgi:RNA polymerase sigma-70 factor (ECF subfamily)
MDELTRLALRAREGDRSALDAFVRRSQADVWRFCAHLGGREHADDLTQSTYLRAWTALARFRGDSSARTWLLAIARRVCADHVRTATRRRRLVERTPRTDGVEASGTGASDLEAMVARLDPDRRAAFVATQILGLPYHDAADALGCPVGTIRSRVARARQELIDALETDDLPGRG